jgi:hypothetical protein
MCFPLNEIVHIVILFIVVIAIIRILWACVEFFGPRVGMGAEILAFVIRIFTIAFWAAICCALVWLVADLIGCLWGMAGGTSLLHSSLFLAPAAHRLSWALPSRWKSKTRL